MGLVHCKRCHGTDMLVFKNKKQIFCSMCKTNVLEVSISRWGINATAYCFCDENNYFEKSFVLLRKHFVNESYDYEILTLRCVKGHWKRVYNLTKRIKKDKESIWHRLLLTPTPSPY